jgi:6-phosphogluconolactonase (cycloisomerase 2 family)
MGTRFRLLPGLLISVFLLGLSGCNLIGNSSPSGTGFLFVSTQGDSLVTPYTIDLTTGLLSTNGAGVTSGGTPVAMLMSSDQSTLFVLNSGTSNNISTFTVKSDGTLSAGSSTPETGMTPLNMTMDSGGHFLFVANQGLQSDPASGTVSVYTVSSNTLSEVAGSPFRVATVSAPTGSGPSAVAVTPDGKFLYVANQFDGTVSSFSVDATSGALTPGIVVSVQIAPAGLGISPNGGFLYVANSGSSSVSAFAVCNQIVTSCADPTSPDGTLTPVAGSPFSAGIGPTAIQSTADGKFLFVVDRQSNQISEYKVATGTGVLTSNTQPLIGTGGSPAGINLRLGIEVNQTTLGTTDYLYVPNLGSSNMTAYSFDSTLGVLGLVGSPVITGGQPSAIATK